jgi:uncharacterized protein
MVMPAHPHRTLSRVEKARLRHLVEAVERETGVEIAALVVPHVQDVEGFAAAYFDRVGIGKRGRDNGVLVLVVTDRRLVRIEVGRGLGVAVSPPAARRIIEDVMAPQFRLGRYGEGLLRGVEALGHLVAAAHARGTERPADPAR